MDRATLLDTIKGTVLKCLPGSRILLFGSHARGNQDPSSDYDLLIITYKTFSPKEKIKWCTQLDRALVLAIHAPVDILIDSEEEIFQKNLLPGHIITSVMRDGVEL